MFIFKPHWVDLAPFLQMGVDLALFSENGGRFAQKWADLEITQNKMNKFVELEHSASLREYTIFKQYNRPPLLFRILSASFSIAALWILNPFIVVSFHKDINWMFVNQQSRNHQIRLKTILR